jgi:hypothetical protein
MTNEEIIKKIDEYQKNEYVHPLTCGKDSNHEVLKGVINDDKVFLICPTCGWVQSCLPRIIFDLTPNYSPDDWGII